jgi:hypothetical protein
MIRILFELSLPEHTLSGLKSNIAKLGSGAQIELHPSEGGGGCQGSAVGGELFWIPCWISLQAESPSHPPLPGLLRRLKELLCAAAQEGGLTLYRIPVTAQVGDEYRRFRDLLEALSPPVPG